jgi:hypothetical protein
MHCGNSGITCSEESLAGTMIISDYVGYETQGIPEAGTHDGSNKSKNLNSKPATEPGVITSTLMRCLENLSNKTCLWWRLVFVSQFKISEINNPTTQSSTK